MRNNLLKVVSAILILFVFSCKEEELETPVEYGQWHTITLAFEGSDTSEDDIENPFLNYALSVEFEHEETKYKVRGYYAADGNAAETGADSGNIWQARFAPDRTGKWTYTAKLFKGDSIALKDDLSQGTLLSISRFRRLLAKRGGGQP